jgi:putative ABC transport system permease protein
MEAVRKDIQFALRGFRKNPGFTVIAALTLMLGIGANSAIFSVVNAVLIRSLPFERPDALVMIWGNVQRTTVERRGASFPDFLDWRAQSRAFVDLAAASNMTYTLAGDEPEPVTGEAVSAGYFSLVGARAMQGRTFRDEEDRPGGERVAIVGHALWQRRFGGDPAIVGRTISLEGRPYTVIGIMPAGFRGVTDRADFWLAFAADSDDGTIKNRGDRSFPVLARLKPGVSLAQAQADITQVCRGLEQAYPVTNEKRSAEVSPLTTELFGDIRPALLAVLGAVGLVLLIACANVASLLLGRAEARQREMALRTALGATRGRLRRQLVVEGLVLTMTAGMFGLLLARWAADALMRFSPVTFPGYVRAELDPTVLLFTLAVCGFAGLLLGLAPLWQIDVSRLAETLKEETGRGTAGKGRLLFRQAIVVAEVALALVLLVGAGLLIRSVVALAAVDPGFKAERLLTLRVSLPAAAPASASASASASAPATPTPSAQASGVSAPPAGAEQGAALPAILERLRGVPGVARVSAGTDAPLGGYANAGIYSAEGQPAMSAENIPRAYRHRVAPGFFSVLGLDLIAGREFTDADVQSARRVVVISEAVAQRFWPGERAAERAVGQRIKYGRADSNAPWLDIVGVVRESRYRELPRNPDPDPDLFLPLAPGSRAFALFIRTHVDAAALTDTIRRELRTAAPDATIFEVSTMEALVRAQMARPRFVTWLMGLFAGVALLLAAIGVYGVMAQAVARRTQEIGIRMALGAARGDILRLVIGRGLLLIGAGVIIGAGLALLLARAIRALLFGVSHADPVTFAGVAALLTLVALAATWIPAWRAMRVDPLVALRRE